MSLLIGLVLGVILLVAWQNRDWIKGLFVKKGE